MGILQRSILSVSRQKLKTFIIFMIVFVIGISLTGTVILKKMTTMIKDNLKSALQAEIIINSDVAKGNYISKAEVEEYARLPEVDYYDYSLTIFLSSIYQKSNIGVEQAMPVENLKNKFLLSGVEYPNLMIIADNKAKLIDGRVFTNEDINKGNEVVIASEQFMQANDLVVGDTLLFENNVTTSLYLANTTILASKALELEIIGIIADLGESAQYDEFVANRLYVPNQVIATELNYQNEVKITNDPSYHAEKYPITAEYRLKSIDALDNTLQLLNNLLVDTYKITSNKIEIDVFIRPIQTLETLFTAFIFVSVVAMISVLAVTLNIFTKSRKKELGIYLAIGESKLKVIAQIIIEVVAVVSIAMVCALIISQIISSKLFEAIVIEQLQSETLSASENVQMMYKMIIGRTSIQLSYWEMINIYIISIATTLVATSIPSYLILKLKPRKILM